jgi:hypothetical protein
VRDETGREYSGQAHADRVTIRAHRRARKRFVEHRRGPGGASPPDGGLEPHRPDGPSYDRGFEAGAAAGCALGRHLEALRWAGEVEHWRRLVRWTAAQRETA